MRSILLLILCLALNGTSAHAFSKKKPVLPPQPLRNYLDVIRVDLSAENSLAGSWPGAVSCGANFKGTHAGNEIVFSVQGSGGAGKYHHVLKATFGSDYKHKGEDNEEHVLESRTGDGKISIRLPELNDDVRFVEQTFILLTRDDQNHSSLTHKRFLITRPITLLPTNRKEAKAKECFERYTSYESNIGALSNSTTSSSSVSIKQGTQKIWSSTKGWQFGVFFSPLSWIGIGNLVSLNASYFTQISKQTVESIEVNESYTLNPGEYAQLYVQPTRYLTAYDANLVSPCGDVTLLPEPVLIQWWGMAYHLYPVNAWDKNKALAEAIGLPAMNTCSKELSPMSTEDAVSTGNYTFTRTNR